ncbi:unnamed protein product [Effrenium voratum]|uniref:Uncharacterized protein n=1 Tax=Effrenium voratum TaxID=2562239 RepID=A0AA36I954_9DINO|nr:unnamed protein product [Effrenium voratum]
MGGSLSQKPCPEDEEVRLPVELQASQYKQRVTRLVEEAQKSPPSESLDVTLRRCIAFCYSVTTEWAPFVRVTVFADNSAEHQLNVPVHSTLLTCLGEPGFETEEVPCKAVPGTDVQFGHVRPSLFWTRRVACRVPLRSLAHIYLKWFADLEDTDERKQLLVNILLQMHEACYNCVGRHKEVFEYCIYDLMQAEEPVPICRGGTHSAQAVCQHAAAFLDRHKRNALHAAFLSPLKFLFQRRYEVFENLDSHGASFWVAILRSFNSDLDMPFENIEELDMGWIWGAVDFLPHMQSSPACTALHRFSQPENLGLDWRMLTKDLPKPQALPGRFRGLPARPGPDGFKEALRRVQQPHHRDVFRSYVRRFVNFFDQEVLLRCWALSAVSSVRWDAELGPALAELDGKPPQELRLELCASDTRFTRPQAPRTGRPT